MGNHFDNLRVDDLGDGITRIAFNRPSQGNTLTAAALDEFERSLETLAADPQARVLVLTGVGDDFCAGRAVEQVDEKAGIAGYRAIFRRITSTNALLEQFPGVSITAIRGRALGLGCGYALRGDLSIAAEDARLGFPEIRRGIPPTIVIGYLSAHIARNRAAELVFLGQELGAREMHGRGLLTEVVQADSLDSRVDEIVDVFRGLDLQAVRASKAFFRLVDSSPIEQSRRLAADEISLYLGEKKFV